MRSLTPARLCLAALCCLLLVARSGVMPGPAYGGYDSSGTVDLIVHTARPYDGLAGQVARMGGAVTRLYQNVDAVALTIPANQVSRLISDPRVSKVEKDALVPLPALPAEHPALTPMTGSSTSPLSPYTLVSQIGELPEDHRSYLAEISGASQVWDETSRGAGTLVAVIDTGTDSGHPCLSGRDSAGLPSTRVIAGPDFSVDAGTEFEGSTASTNNYHGTFAAGMAASNCFISLDERLPEDAELAAIFQDHLPPGTVFDRGHNILVPLMGLAPEAGIYAVKVFPRLGGGASLSRINAALDHLITLRKLANARVPGGLRVDIINMSLGGASLADGMTLQERLVDQATRAGMLVVASAGNEGPAPVSVSAPGTAYTALTAGAASDPVHTRIFWDVLFGRGNGNLLHAGGDIRAADFSARGPLADGRSGPDVLATGVFNFSLMPDAGTGWASGTSFSAPAVAGGAALLTAWARTHRPEAGPLAIRHAIIESAVPIGPGWRRRSQGGGYINVARALDMLKHNEAASVLRHAGPDQPLPNVRFQDGIFTSQVSSLGPAKTVDFVFRIEPDTTAVVIDLTEVSIDPDPAPTPIPNSIELYLKGSKRGGTSYVLYSANVYDRSRIVIRDGSIGLYGRIFPFTVGRSPLEPGLMKLTIQGDWTNNGDVGAVVTIRRYGGKETSPAGQVLTQGDTVLVPVHVRQGTSELSLQLGWRRDWSRFPTSDLDLYLCAPGFHPHFDFRGATLDSPEKLSVFRPQPGTWYAVVVGFGVATGRDRYYLDVETVLSRDFGPDNPSTHLSGPRLIGPPQAHATGPASFHDSEDGHRELAFQGKSCF